MKNIFFASTLLFVMNVRADIEYSPAQSSAPTETELNKSRSCWEELRALGCGDPGEEPQHFRSCLKDVKSTLTDSCRSMMTELYGK